MRMKKIVENRTVKSAAAEFIAFKRAQKIRERILHDYQKYVDPQREAISTNSSRKRYGTEIYKADGCDIALAQRHLQYRSAAATQRYIGMEPQRIEQVIQNHVSVKTSGDLK